MCLIIDGQSSMSGASLILMVNDESLMRLINSTDAAKLFYGRNVSPGGSGSGWTRTLDLGLMRRVFYHCAMVKQPSA
jgi:hypothetical protein